MSRYALVRVDDERVTRLRVYHDDGTGPLEPDGYFVPVPPDDRQVKDLEWAIDLAAHLLLHDENQDEPITGLERLRNLRASFSLDEGSET